MLNDKLTQRDIEKISRLFEKNQEEYNWFCKKKEWHYFQVPYTKEYICDAKTFERIKKHTRIDIQNNNLDNYFLYKRGEEKITSGYLTTDEFMLLLLRENVSEVHSSTEIQYFLKVMFYYNLTVDLIMYCIYGNIEEFGTLGWDINYTLKKLLEFYAYDNNFNDFLPMLNEELHISYSNMDVDTILYLLDVPNNIWKRLVREKKLNILKKSTENTVKSAKKEQSVDVENVELKKNQENQKYKILKNNKHMFKEKHFLITILFLVFLLFLSFIKYSIFFYSAIVFYSIFEIIQTKNILENSFDGLTLFKEEAKIKRKIMKMWGHGIKIPYYNFQTISNKILEETYCFFKNKKTEFDITIQTIKEMEIPYDRMDDISLLIVSKKYAFYSEREKECFSELQKIKTYNDIITKC